MGNYFNSENEHKQTPISSFIISHNLKQIIANKPDSAYMQPNIYKARLTGENYALLQLKSHKNKEKIEKIKENIQIYSSIDDKNLVKIQCFYIKTHKTGLLAKTYDILAIFDYYYYSLLNNLESIARNNAFYEENEIWYILKSLLSAIKSLNEIQGFHNNLRLDTILVDYNGEIKLFPNYLLGKKALAGYQMSEFMNKDYDFCYLNSKMLKVLENMYENNKEMREIFEKNAKFEEKVEENSKKASFGDFFKNLKNNRKTLKFTKSIENDVFAIGMIAIELCTLKNVITCYNFEDFTINFDKIEIFLENIAENYSFELYNFIKHLIRAEDFNITAALEDIETIKIAENLKISLKKSQFQSPEKKLKTSDFNENFSKNQKFEENNEFVENDKNKKKHRNFMNLGKKLNTILSEPENQTLEDINRKNSKI